MNQFGYGAVLTADKKCRLQKFGKYDLLSQLQETVGGYIETVPCGDAVMILDEEGRLKGKKRNIAASFLTNAYGGIMGDAVVMAQEPNEEGEMELRGFTADQATNICRCIAILLGYQMEVQ